MRHLDAAAVGHPDVSLRVDGPGVVCDLCGQTLESGTTAAIYNEAPIVTHDPRTGCPPRVELTVVDGGVRRHPSRGRQSQLPCLVSVPDDEASP